MARYGQDQPEPPKCFDSKNYESISGVGEADIRQCVAPTQKGRRCSWNIPDDDPDDECMKIARLRSTIEGLERGRKRNQLLKEYILLRCCTKWHRDKLQSEPGCCEKLAERLDTEIWVKGTPAGPPETSSTTRTLHWRPKADLP
jgi:hypothetical protein